MKLLLLSHLCISIPAVAQDEVVIGLDTRDGKLMYEAWCARCHGDDGKGPAEGIVLETPVPNFSDCSFTSREPRKDWQAVIMHGGPARGLSMTMPSWGEALSLEQADAIIGHIKTFCSESGWPEGELNFRRAQVTGKAFPENEVLIIPTFTAAGSRSSSTKLAYESRICKTGQWEIALPFARGPASSGLGDIELAGKYTFHQSVSSLSIASVGVEVVVPSGSESKGLGDGIWKLAPFLAAAKGFGRSFLQSSIKLEHPLHSGQHTELFYNVAWTLPLTNEKKGFHPAIEFNGLTTFNESTTLFVTPQLYYAISRKGHIAISLGAQIPVTGPKPFDYKIVSFLLWEYADGGLWW
ncbi:MAG: c-type cytochrome [Bacteroidota bacterium]